MTEEFLYDLEKLSFVSLLKISKPRFFAYILHVDEKRHCSIVQLITEYTVCMD